MTDNNKSMYCKRNSLLIGVGIVLIVALSSCGGCTGGCAPAKRGVYHWKTTYNPTAWERQWMREHRVDKLYIKLFDVKPGSEEGYPDWTMVPAASTTFLQPLPEDMEVVPVVYITVEAIRGLGYDTRRYAELIVGRIDDMMKDNDKEDYGELQIDCDWTQQTESAYFRLAADIRSLLHARHIALSATVRLHQLRRLEPSAADSGGATPTLPFDRMLLMCYNTGQLQQPDTENSILDYDDVKPYLRQYHSHRLPHTDVAFPVYGWGVEFDSKGNFRRLVNSQQLDAERKQANGNSLREEWGDMQEIVRTQQALPVLDSIHTTILYHLDSTNLSKYSYEDIETIYSR